VKASIELTDDDVVMEVRRNTKSRLHTNSNELLQLISLLSFREPEAKASVGGEIVIATHCGGTVIVSQYGEVR
jgi:hypothetical protein